MRILLAIPGTDSFAGLTEIANHLNELGHTIFVAHPPVTPRTEISFWHLRQFQEKTKNGMSVPLHGLELKFRTLKKDIWGLINCGIYVKPAHPVAWLGERRIQTDLSQFARFLMRFSPIRKVLLGNWFQAVLKRLEGSIPPNAQVIEWLEENKPDVVVVSPFIFFPFGEVEYVKAAKKMNIPVVVIISSWDNLSSKGTFHHIPDITLVWNDWLADQAVNIHSVPRSSIVVTGAAKFDPYFCASPSRKRDDFLKLAGLEPGCSFITYFGSSNFVSKYSETGSESVFFQDFAKRLHEHPATKDLKILVRPHPHPKSRHVWHNFKALENVAVWDFDYQVDEKALENFKKDLFDTILYSEAVVAMNTSGFIDAAILNKPCISIVVPDYQKGTEDLYHFRHLLEEDFLSVARSIDFGVENITKILGGQDEKRIKREQFVEKFVRPLGRNAPAGLAAAKAIELAGGGKKGSEIIYRLLEWKRTFQK